MARSPLLLGSESFTLEDVRDAAYGKRSVSFPKPSRARVTRAAKFLRAEAAKEEPIYGVNTGFGMLSGVRVPSDQSEALQRNLLRSHAVGTGNEIPEAAVRAMLILRAHALALGYSGVSPGLIDLLASFVNRGVHPIVPEQGSVGASGDLAPLAHLALPLIGEGKARYKGKVLSGAKALDAAKLKPLMLGPKEGLALINGTQFMMALGLLALLEAEHLADLADLAAAMTLEALRGTKSPFDPLVHRVRPHAGQVEVARRMRVFLGKGSGIAKSHEDCGKVQDPYSLRCVPQVHGPIRDALRFVRETLETELHSTTDNPLVFAKEKKILSGGNFHGENLAIAMDLLAIVTSELASISEQRIEKLMNPVLSGLPAFLAREGGLHSGFMIVQVAAASIVSENKTLCHPASVDSIPTSADKEDHVSMGAWGARKAWKVVENARRVLAMEFLAASQGIEFLRPLRSTSKVEAALKKIRSKVPPITGDREFHLDIQAVEKLLSSRALEREVRA